MSDQEQDLPDEEQEDLSVEERAKPLRLAALASHGYLDSDGITVLDGKIEDKLFEIVSKAECNRTADRKTKAITRTQLTRGIVPNMPGPGDYTETDDPEAAALAWSQINTSIWRMLDMNDGGRVQTRLNGEHAVLLCRTTATSEKGVEGVYVTTDWDCIAADFVRPDQKKIVRAIDQMAANGRMATERLPEHGKKLRRELQSETKRALDSGVSLISRQIEAASETNGDEDETEGGASVSDD